MNIKKIMLPMKVYCLIILAYLLISPFTALADPKTDPLQSYRDEIKKAETNAAQSVLDQLGPSVNDSSKSYSDTPSVQSAPPAPPSDSERAFSPDQTPKNSTPKPNNTNPWLKPNPWEAQSKINPWANAPIPSPATPNNSSNAAALPSPPNIFAPPHAIDNTPNKTMRNNTNNFH